MCFHDEALLLLSTCSAAYWLHHPSCFLARPSTGFLFAGRRLVSGALAGTLELVVVLLVVSSVGMKTGVVHGCAAPASPDCTVASRDILATLDMLVDYDDDE